MAAANPWPRDVFVLGAGFSKAVWDQFPLTTELYPKCIDRMRADNMEAADDPLVLDGYSQLGEDFETWLTWLGGGHPWLAEASSLRQRAAFLDVSAALARVILGSQNEAISGLGARPPDWLRDLVNAWANRSVGVITTNYDLLVEKTYETVVPANHSVLYTVPMASLEGAATYGGAPTYRFQLLKLHGSVSWYVFTSGGESTAGPVYDAGLSLGWAAPDDLPSLIRRVGSRRPLLVPPVVGKDPFLDRPELRDQWLRAADLIDTAERIFVAGYSLPPADLAMRFLLNRVRDGCEVFAVNRDADFADRLTAAVGHPVDRRYSGRAGVIEEMAATY